MKVPRFGMFVAMTRTRAVLVERDEMLKSSVRHGLSFWCDELNFLGACEVFQLAQGQIGNDRVVPVRTPDDGTGELLDSRQDFSGDRRPNVDEDSSFGILFKWNWFGRNSFRFSLAAHLINGVEELRVDLLLLGTSLFFFLIPCSVSTHEVH